MNAYYGQDKLDLFLLFNLAIALPEYDIYPINTKMTKITTHNVWAPDNVQRAADRVESRFYEPPAITRSERCFSKSIKHCNFTVDFWKYLIFRTNFRFPWNFEKSGFHLNQREEQLG